MKDQQQEMYMDNEGVGGGEKSGFFFIGRVNV